MKEIPQEILERRAKREAKRMKQRQDNVMRAAKMHRARLAEDIKSKVLPKFKTKYHIGCSGWFYWHWRGGFYPEGLPTNKWFSRYADEFKTVELNAPFYSWPTVNTVKSWIKQLEKRSFVYTVKVSELITHTKKFSGTKTLVKDFNFIADLLGPKMGCFLYQLPPSFHYTKGRLDKIVEQLDKNYRNVVEFRHKSWWNKEVYKAFKAKNIIFCSCSGPRLPDDLVKTADDIYVRFHGVKQWYRHDYSREELKTWALKIKKANAKNVWIYFNNDRNEHAIKNARELRRLLK